MSTTEYYRLALLQYIKMQHNLQEINNSLTQIDQLKEKISAKHKKHRRCDKQIHKNYECEHCQRVYASQVALRLHLKLKHKETLQDKHGEWKTSTMSDSDKQNININVESLI